MIGGIDSDIDIVLYLEAGEVVRLPKERLEGVLVKTFKPKRQGRVSLSVDNSRKDEKGCGVGIDDSQYWGVQEGFRVDVFMGDCEYQDFLESGRFGIRHRVKDGSKITILDISRAEFVEKEHADFLKFYRDNKDKLRPELG